jgi:hypothetical protein
MMARDAMLANADVAFADLKQEIERLNLALAAYTA